MPEVNFNLLNPSAELYSGPQVQMDPVAAYEKAKATRQSNMLAQLYAKHYDPQTGGVNYNALIGDAAQTGLAEHIPSILGEAQKQAQAQAVIEHNQQLAAQEAATAAAKKQEMDRANLVNMATDAYSRLHSVKNADELIAWHTANPEPPGTNKEQTTTDLKSRLAQYGYDAVRSEIEGRLQDITGIKPKEYTPPELERLISLRNKYPVGTQERTDLENKIKLETTRAPAASTNVSISTAKGIAENVGDIAKTSRTQATGAIKTMTSANEIRNALNSGLVIAGPTADLQMKFNQLLTEAGKGSPEKSKQLAQTRTAIINLSKLTLAARAELQGSGAISDFETKLLERAQSGDINDMSVEELQTVVDAAQKGAQFLWSEHQGLLDTMKSDPETAKLARYYTPAAKMPEAAGRTSTAAPSVTTAATTNVVRPKNVPANWTLEVDSKGNKAYVSPDRKQHVEVK